MGQHQNFSFICLNFSSTTAFSEISSNASIIAICDLDALAPSFFGLTTFRTLKIKSGDLHPDVC
ncbi:MAG: hypothetical protein GW779_03205 [Candidatus Altiarchaeum hamiconexum]|uniref:Uncharacterized protein n=1 Tax=Candidatus Altarchaeum hamiconexum TaxID=1803513 RepID=A0A8J8CFX0_9ARCH|nr:hypothetical protein [Candidatus Altarchaeum hamiconexum]OIQ05934.1 MAG: hypothetical protein AUK59_01880 [Candidatus Altarchaeum sp. CG2_30_32_3053]PJC12953.1 MAG: hypothetical protein CO063_04975 [Candidatus Altarchaeum sp. CG_4_9_14_0_8_um_filter_32_206]NCN69268.1 hypothetical protein [Candidatus Altarchaeum hamiconexum]NCS91407.1 hypothetical protein [Candidatus Altarchaeum hamiconexum]